MSFAHIYCSTTNYGRLSIEFDCANFTIKYVLRPSFFIYYPYFLPTLSLLHYNFKFLCLFYIFFNKHSFILILLIITLFVCHTATLADGHSNAAHDEQSLLEWIDSNFANATTIYLWRSISECKISPEMTC